MERGRIDEEFRYLKRKLSRLHTLSIAYAWSLNFLPLDLLVVPSYIRQLLIVM